MYQQDFPLEAYASSRVPQKEIQNSNITTYLSSFPNKMQRFFQFLLILLQNAIKPMQGKARKSSKISKPQQHLITNQEEN